MNKFELSLHGIEQMNIRGVPEEIVFEVLENPDKIDVENEGQLIYGIMYYLAEMLIRRINTLQYP